ncbi:DmpA/ArgJ-like protein [Viridothelium virens]|uniref:DmpA/ArgJ-like protein n=1 Tax=Viridothelium virens TaxID=1048519 RepID=A0A6A6GTI3_VIRVR|nr:DmpA/ArgJ-like protein [Viridothelium virens]
MRIRDLGYAPSSLPPGPSNSLLDIPGVSIGQTTQHDGSTHKGVTAIFPRPTSSIQTPCYAGISVLNGNGEMTGKFQVADWGFTNTPILLTNSCSLGVAIDEAWKWLLDRMDAQGMDELAQARNYGTPVVAETADWYLNGARESRIDGRYVREALEMAAAGAQKEVKEGSEGGGAGMTCHQFKGGTGTSSRVVATGGSKEYSVGVLVQSNYGHMPDLRIGGVPVGKVLKKELDERGESLMTYEKKVERSAAGTKSEEGSIVIVIITDAPLLPTQLQRLARHAGVGLAQVGGPASTGRTHSGDIFLALSTAAQPVEQLSPEIKLKTLNPTETYSVDVVKNESIDAFFCAAAEATEEAILNSLVAARDGMTGIKGRRVEGLPVERVKELLEKHLVKV